MYIRIHDPSPTHLTVQHILLDTMEGSVTTDYQEKTAPGLTAEANDLVYEWVPF